MTDGQQADCHRPSLQRYLFACPREVISAPAIDLERAIGGRHLLDRAGKARQDRLYISECGPRITGRRHHALSIQRIGLLAKFNREIIDLVAIQHASGEFGRLAYRNGKHALGQRIERTAMANLRFGHPSLAQSALDRAHGLRTAHATGFVED